MDTNCYAYNTFCQMHDDVIQLQKLLLWVTLTEFATDFEVRTNIHDTSK